MHKIKIRDYPSGISGTAQAACKGIDWIHRKAKKFISNECVPLSQQWQTSNSTENFKGLV